MEQNNKIVKLLVFVFIFLFFGFPIITEIIADAVLTTENGEGFDITHLDYKAIIIDDDKTEQNKLLVTERITFDINAGGEPCYELWLDLWEEEVDGTKLSYKINSVKQIKKDETTTIWPEAPRLYWYDSDYEPPYGRESQFGPYKWYYCPKSEDAGNECLFFYIPPTYRGEMTFEIEYEVENAVRQYNDCADFDITIYSDNNCNALQSANVEILVPNHLMPRKENYVAMGYGTIEEYFHLDESADKYNGYYTFSVNFDEDDLKFKRFNEYLSFNITTFGEDKHIFAKYAGWNEYKSYNALEEIRAEQKEYEGRKERYHNQKLCGLAICILLSVLAILFSVRKLKKIRQRHSISIDDGKNASFRDIPSDIDPNFAAALVGIKDKKPIDKSHIYSSILLSLARKQYIEMEEKYNDDIMVTILERDPNAPEPVYNNEQIDTDTTNYDYNTEYKNSFDYTNYDTPNSMYDVANYETNGEVNADNLNTESTFIEPVYIDTREELSESEKLYLRLLQRHAVGGRIGLTTLQRRIESDFDYTVQFADDIEKSILDYGIKNKYFAKVNYKEPQQSIKTFANVSIVLGIITLLSVMFTLNYPIQALYGGLFILGFALILNGIFAKKQRHKYVLLTEFGEQEYQKWKGLYNFLKSDTLLHEKTFVELPLWERYLVYATAFGIAEKVTAAIKIRCQQTVETPSIIYHSSVRSGRIHHHGHRFHSSIRRSHHSYHSHHYGSGGRGYGGGGG